MKRSDMLREDGREPVTGYCIQILTIDGQVQEDIAQKSFYVENISRGGFRFIASIGLEIDNRLQVVLKFPDERTEEVLGRICYCDETIKGDDVAYGFSVIEGFYQLFSKAAAR
jgi:hypothetical protein